MADSSTANTPLAASNQPAIVQPATVQNVFIGVGCPPVLIRLVKKIESGAFIKMAKLLPEQLGASNDDDSKVKQKKCSISILEWLQCYSVYVAVLAKRYPERITDLMGYQSLIIEACMEYRNNCWIGYDRRFHLQTASQPNRNWATVDATLWNLAFAEQARTSRCKHCFSLSHQSTDCELSPEVPTKSSQSGTPKYICFRWNNSVTPTCSFPNCKFQHICYICAHDPAITNVLHKAIHCPQQHPVQQSIKPLFSAHNTPKSSASSCI